MVAGIVKRGMSFAAGSAAFSHFVSLLERFGDRKQNLLRILTYHRVSEPEDCANLDPTLLSATPRMFHRQMEYLAENYRVVSVEELHEAVYHQSPLPPRSVMITFDDAYCDFAESVWPVLKPLGLPVTLFVPTAFPDQPDRVFWWDRLFEAVNGTKVNAPIATEHGTFPLQSPRQRMASFRKMTTIIKSLPHTEAQTFLDRVDRQLGSPPVKASVLGWEELRRLASEGVTLGAHARTHPLLNRISPEEARTEAVESQRDLEREIGPVRPILAYPAGGVSAEVACMLKAAGFQLGFTTSRGINDLRTADPFLLNRINIGRRTTEALLRMQLLPWMRFASSSPIRARD